MRDAQNRFITPLKGYTLPERILTKTSRKKGIAISSTKENPLKKPGTQKEKGPEKEGISILDLKSLGRNSRSYFI